MSAIPRFKVPLSVVEDTSLSFEARGLYIYLISLQDFVQIAEQIYKFRNDKITRELVRAGLIAPEFVEVQS